MSYDLTVFEPAGAPKDHKQFVKWYAAQTEWKDGEVYDDPAVCTPSLQAWLSDMFAAYPPMNGPSASAEIPEDEATLADYGIRQQLVYVSFAWSKAQIAYEDVFRLATKHRLGFFNTSSDTGVVWLPAGEKLVPASEAGRLSVKSRMLNLFSAFRILR